MALRGREHVLGALMYWRMRCGRRCRADRGFAAATDWYQPQRCWSCRGCVDRLAGHPRVQRAIGCASGGRDNAAFACPRGLRTDDARRGTLPNGVDDGRAALAVSGPGRGGWYSKLKETSMATASDTGNPPRPLAPRLRVGDEIPVFSLPNTSGVSVSSTVLLA